MTTFTLQLWHALGMERIENVTSFVGEDASGSFGILAGRARFMTSLVFGLARFRCADEDWRYLAVPGALVYFADNQLMLTTRRYLIDTDYARVSTALQDQLLSEEMRLHEMRNSLRRMEETFLRRMTQLGEEGMRYR